MEQTRKRQINNLKYSWIYDLEYLDLIKLLSSIIVT